MAKILEAIPRLISSKPHVIGLIALGVYLIVAPLLGLHVSNFAELLGGNYTNVSSAIGSAIAAGGTVHLVGQSKRSSEVADETREIASAAHRIVADLHQEVAGYRHPDSPQDSN